MNSIKKSYKYEYVYLNGWKIKKYKSGHMYMSRLILYNGSECTAVMKTVTSETEKRLTNYVQFAMMDGTTPIEQVTGVRIIGSYGVSEWIPLESVGIQDLDYLTNYSNKVLDQVGAHDDDSLHLRRIHPEPVKTQSLIDKLNAIVVYENISVQSAFQSCGLIIDDIYYETISGPGIKIKRDPNKLVKEVWYKDNLDDAEVNYFESSIDIVYNDDTHDVTKW